jgi:hypothetical protein
VLQLITESFFIDLVKELAEEHLPKVRSADRKDFAISLLAELKSHGVEFEEETIPYPPAEPFDD